MAVLKILNQVKGPLPLNANFTGPSDAPSCFVLAGSVWSTTPNQVIGVQLQLDGKVIGTASIYSNAASTHRVVVPSYIPVTLSIGPHSISVVPLNSHTTTDYNDFFEVVLLY